MLYVFLVDSGRMLTFDVNYAFKPVSYVKTAIWEECGIPEEKQVLIVSGGECLDSSAKICTYSAGTDTSPIFLFNKLCIDNPISAYSKMDNGIDILVKEQVEGSLLLLPSFTTLVSRTQLAQQLNDMSKKEMSACERTVHDQHVMQQAWAAVTANLDDAVSAFERRGLSMFNYYGHTYMTRLRPKYVSLIDRLPRDCKVLADLPFLLTDPSTGTPIHGFNEPKADEMGSFTFLDWIKSKDKKGDIMEMIESCRLQLERYNDDLFHEMRAEFTVALDATRNQPMKEIRGLEDRLYGLEQLLYEARSSLNQQNELTQGFLQNQHRASKENDLSILPDLCSSHKRQLLYMLKNYQHIKDISQRCTVAKEELASNLNARLRWVSFVEKQMCLVDGKICAHYKKLRDMDNSFSLLQQIHVSPFLYVISLLEIERRKNFSTTYAQVINVMWKKLHKVYSAEKEKRALFKNLIDNHFIHSLLPYIDENVSRYGITDEPPKTFDNALRQMPDPKLKNIALTKRKEGKIGHTLNDDIADKLCDGGRETGRLTPIAQVLKEALSPKSLTIPGKAKIIDGDASYTKLPPEIEECYYQCMQLTVCEKSLHLKKGIKAKVNASSYPLSLVSTLFKEDYPWPDAENCVEVELETLKSALLTAPHARDPHVPNIGQASKKKRHSARTSKILSSFYAKSNGNGMTRSAYDLGRKAPEVTLHTIPLKVNVSNVVQALVLANLNVPGQRKGSCDEMRLKHLGHSVSRACKELRSVRHYAKANTERLTVELGQLNQILSRAISNYDRTSLQNYETFSHNIKSHYDNLLREYEIKMELQEAASDDTDNTANTHLSPSPLAETYTLASTEHSIPTRTTQSLCNIDIPSFALKLELQAEVVKAQSLAQAAFYKNQMAEMSKVLAQKESEILRLSSSFHRSIITRCEPKFDKALDSQVMLADTTIMDLTPEAQNVQNYDKYKVDSSSPILGEAGIETEDGSYYFDDYDYGDGCELTMIVGGNDSHITTHHQRPQTSAAADQDSGNLSDGQEIGNTNFIPDCSSLLFLSSLGDAMEQQDMSSDPLLLINDNSVGDIKLGESNPGDDNIPCLPIVPIPFYPEMPYLHFLPCSEPQASVVLGTETILELQKSKAQQCQSVFSSLRILEHLDSLHQVIYQDLIIALHHYASYANEPSIFVCKKILNKLFPYETSYLSHDQRRPVVLPESFVFFDFAQHVFDNTRHILNSHYEYAKSFNVGTLNYIDKSITISPMATLGHDDFIRTIFSQGIGFYPDDAIHSHILTLSIMENLWRIVDYGCKTYLKGNTNAQSITNDWNRGLNGLPSSSSLAFLDLETGYHHPKSPEALPNVLHRIQLCTKRDDVKFNFPLQGHTSMHRDIFSQNSLGSHPNAHSLIQFAPENLLLESTLDVQASVPDSFQTTMSPPPKSHSHQPKLTISSCTPGDVVVFYRDKEHRDNFVAYMLDREKHFLHSDSFSSFGLDDKGGGPSRHHNLRSFIIGRVLSKELCLAKKFPNRFQIPQGTIFYRIRLGPLPPSSPESHQLIERFVSHSKNMFDKIFKF